MAIAFQVFGSGPLDLVVTPGFVSHRELEWEHPGAVRFYERLAAFARVIVFDKRGTGMSDRVAVATLEERIDDIRAVMDAAGSERAALLGMSEGGSWRSTSPQPTPGARSPCCCTGRSPALFGPPITQSALPSSRGCRRLRTCVGRGARLIQTSCMSMGRVLLRTLGNGRDGRGICASAPAPAPSLL